MSYFLGLPMWSNRDWIGSLFPVGAGSKNFLHHYSRAFNTVEGNTTFYALPSVQTVSSWCEQLQPGFRFSFKLPREITHGRTLGDAQLQRDFFRRLAPLADAMGPVMVQLPAQVGGEQLPVLEQLLIGLPADFHYSVEVRHPIFFQKGDAEKALNQLLLQRGIDRVCFDSRALFSRPPQNDADHDAQRKKPRLPVHAIATGQNPVVRFIGTEVAEINRYYLQPWRAKLQQWLEEGRTPYFFIHTPSNLQAPQQALAFHNSLQQLPGWQPLPWQGGAEQLAFF
jgi:uncharacterized protein YecE (DUF72 family)